MNSQAWFLVEEAVIPLLIAGVIVLGRKAIRRTVLYLSAGALVFVGVKWGLFAVENAQGAFQADGWLRYPLEPSLLTLDTIRNVALTFALFLGIAAWILVLFDTASEQRWGWFSGILAVSVFSYVIAAIDISPVFMRENAVFDQLMRAHALTLTLLLGTLAHPSVLVTLLYALIVRAKPHHRSDVS